MANTIDDVVIGNTWANAYSLSLVTSAQAASILSTPALNSENSALRKVFYGEDI